MTLFISFHFIFLLFAILCMPFNVCLKAQNACIHLFIRVAFAFLFYFYHFLSFNLVFCCRFWLVVVCLFLIPYPVCLPYYFLFHGVIYLNLPSERKFLFFLLALFESVCFFKLCCKQWFHILCYE